MNHSEWLSLIKIGLGRRACAEFARRNRPLKTLGPIAAAFNRFSQWNFWKDERSTYASPTQSLEWLLSGEFFRILRPNFDFRYCELKYSGSLLGTPRKYFQPLLLFNDERDRKYEFSVDHKNLNSEAPKYQMGLPSLGYLYGIRDIHDWSFVYIHRKGVSWLEFLCFLCFAQLR